GPRRLLWCRGSRSVAALPVAGRFEAEDGTRVPVDRVVGAVDAQLTAHPQVDNQAEFGRGLARTSRRPCSARTRITRPVTRTLQALTEAAPHALPSAFGT